MHLVMNIAQAQWLSISSRIMHEKSTVYVPYIALILKERNDLPKQTQCENCAYK